MLRSARAVATLALVTCAGALVAAACSSSYSEAPATDAGSDASDAGAADAEPPADPCAHAGLPASPPADDAPGTSLPAFTLAFTSDADGGGVEPGFDLDGVCTCETRPGTAHDGGESCVRAKGTARSCDGDGGVDNVLANLYAQFASFFPLGNLTGQQIDRGRSDILLQIGDYNGAANDPDVSVAMLESQGIKVQGCPSSTLDPDLNTWSPGWCGDDAWTVTPGSVIGGTIKAPVFVGRGFVRDRVLVVQIAGAPRVPFSDEYAVPLTDPMIMGKLVPLGEDLQPRDPARAPVGREPRLWRIEAGRLAGRVASREIVTGIGVTKVNGDGGLVQLCSTAGFPALKGILCAASDIPRAKAFDFDPAAACDAVSSATTFVAGPALLGDVYERVRKVGSCDPGPNGDPLDAGALTYGCP